MNPNRSFGLWKAIAFLTVVISLSVSCSSCEPEIDLYPKISLLNAENVTATSAVLVASLTTKGEPLSVVFEYSDSEVEKVVVSAIYPANQTVVVKQEVTGLTQGKVYQISAKACSIINNGGPTRFATVATAMEKKTFTTLDPSSLTIKEIKSDLTSISVKLELIPKAANTKVRLDYTLNGSVMTKISEAYSGNSAVEINFKLDNLVKNTDYQIKIKTLNEFAVSLDTIFKTCAVSDFDGNAYHIVTIGNQVWLQENFKGTHFANGDPIPNVTDQSAWDAMTTPAYCWYNNDPKIGEVYGGLYNWYVASDPRGLIIGYHTPSLDEWRILADYLGGEEVAGGKMKEAGYTHWTEMNVGATNSSGFCGLPGGARDKVFLALNGGGPLWSTTLFGNGIFAYLSNIGETSARLKLQGGSYCSVGLGIRLVKN
ncbi:MAG: FISUMP domain-containing protein [Paludibacter sp.]